MKPPEGEPSEGSKVVDAPLFLVKGVILPIGRRRAFARNYWPMQEGAFYFFDAGHTSLRGTATTLSERGIPTARGGGKWSAVQVARTLNRI